MHPLLLIDVVALTPRLLGAHTPNLAALARSGCQCVLEPPLPAVTCTSQSTMLTGLMPNGHGVVGNGWYFRDLAQVMFWRQSNPLVAGEKIWDAGRRRDPRFTCAQLFWWFNMYSSADIAVTPRPAYPADGRKIADVYTVPAPLARELQERHGQFPLFQFWGPKAGLASTQWIVASALDVMQRAQPTLTLVYLPHLDYDLQRFGPSHARALAAAAELDREVGRLLAFARERDLRVLVVSEYGMADVTRDVAINRALRAANLLAVHEQVNGENLDAGASRAFAVVDHQLAHIHVRDPRDLAAVRDLVQRLPGVAQVLDQQGKRAHGLDHPRSGELVALAERDAWFSYYYWLDERKRPDFAPTVDIHRKPGYDPSELFLDPAQKLIALKIAWLLARKTLGCRYLMDVIPTHGGLVRGSHGLLPASPQDAPLLLSSTPLGAAERLSMTQVKQLVLDQIFA